MFLLNKKRILFILSTIIFSITLYSSSTNNIIVETVSTPVSNHTIIIDAGHGLPDAGANSTDGTSEENINLNISLKLQKLLEASGSTVILTRSDENGIYDINSKNKKSSDLKNRVNLANTSNAEIFVSIHLNKIDITSCHGWQSFYQKNNENSKLLANYIQKNLNYSIQKNNKRDILPLSGKYIIDNIKIPTVIVECGFLSNPSELNNLKTESYQENLAWGIYTGIIDYFSNTML